MGAFQGAPVQGVQSPGVIHTLVQPLLLVIAGHLTQCAAARQVIPGRTEHRSTPSCENQGLQAPNIVGQTGQNHAQMSYQVNLLKQKYTSECLGQGIIKSIDS